MAVEADLLHASHPAKVFGLNIDVERHLGHSFKVKGTIGSCRGISLEAVFDFGDSGPDHSHLETCTVFLPNAFGITGSSNIRLIDDQVRYSLIDNE